MNDGDPVSPNAENAPYTVLARKYRPQDFDALIGQEALVTVLRNAFERDRIAHAFMLTGVRGVGKTTTARIIAKGLNCTASDRPTIKPCGVCENCVAIAESRHVDVLEMDAASRTGIDDIREITESVRYRAAQGRYKVYIIDEVHMLSKAAFNGLLKTLEEPPAHVKFILATTDIHKVPVTVLSRCMRFDLRRVEAEQLTAHLKGICDNEGVNVSIEALNLIARASEGSVRDSLSLLDQAISHGAGQVDDATARDMLGLSEHGRILDLFEHVMRGRTSEALTTLRTLYVEGGDPLSLLRELAEATHLVSMIKVEPARADDPTLPPTQRDRARELSATLPMRSLSRAWQMLLKAIEETSRAPSALAAAEMAIIRLTHVAELPSPEELVRRLSQAGQTPTGASGGNGAGLSPSEAPHAVAPGHGGRSQGGDDAPRAQLKAVAGGAPEPQLQPTARAHSELKSETLAEPVSQAETINFEELIAILRSRRDKLLEIEVERYVRPGVIRQGFFEFTPTADAPKDLAAKLGKALSEYSGARWLVSVADHHETPTIAETKATAQNSLRARALDHPLLLSALETFPGAQIGDVRDLTAHTADGDAAAPEDDDDEDLPLIVDEWDDRDGY
ncbi:MAG: DNA polymerase III subunit gamma/tau [Neomegalonema sp.]